MTARYWRKRPPMPGEIITASTGRRKETRFAKLKIIKVTTWRPGQMDAPTLLAKTGYTPQQIAEKEGYKNFPEFMNAYTALNKHLDPFDPKRTHYFIEFKLVEVLR
ncbi:ASCH domain-containing protein [Candidatus Poribacteria bacterium]|nr:ASCH domain-containing protein [Candidatus Poribacteria bacterium]MYB02513.1 ASCH domain-containing protein [Candidatus Poribacteria bacterium]